MHANKKKVGFTLIELMVVAIIVAILAAVAIPLMMGNKKRAMATEADAGIGAVRTALRVNYADKGVYPPSGAASTIPGIGAGDLDGLYFSTPDYAFTIAGSNQTITATGNSGGSTAVRKSEVAGVVVVFTSVDGQWQHNGL